MVTVPPPLSLVYRATLSIFVVSSPTAARPFLSAIATPLRVVEPRYAERNVHRFPSTSATSRLITALMVRPRPTFSSESCPQVDVLTGVSTVPKAATEQISTPFVPVNPSTIGITTALCDTVAL